jgi:hypothetical protein
MVCTCTRDGALTRLSRSRWQGVVSELMGTIGSASGNKSGGGAHRGGDVTTGQRDGSVRRRVAASSPEGGSAVTPTSSRSYGGGRER